MAHPIEEPRAEKHMRNGRKREDEAVRSEPEQEQDFFDSVFDEVTSALSTGTRFAPDAIEQTFSNAGGRR